MIPSMAHLQCDCLAHNGNAITSDDVMMPELGERKQLNILILYVKDDNLYYGVHL